uniref:Uncharacterized protein n=1 Tax=Trichogramma kaykai TaxID=54128 RepID=A0ABD2WNG2_9HYME
MYAFGCARESELIARDARARPVRGGRYLETRESIKRAVASLAERICIHAREHNRLLQISKRQKINMVTG